MTRFGLRLKLTIVVIFVIVSVGCVQPETGRNMPPRPPTASSVFTPTSGPTPDIRATVVAEITATAVAASTETLAPTATAVLPIPPGAFFSVGRTTPQATPTPTVAPIVTSPASTTPLVTPTQTPTHAPVPVNTPTLASVVEDISPSVVQIITPDGNGSGFVTDADGRIVTNAHVVKGLSGSRGEIHRRANIHGQDSGCR